MAYVEERKGGYLVVWNEDGRKKSRLVSWIGGGKPGTVGEGPIDKEATRANADALAAEMKKNERAYRKPLERVAKWSKEDGYEPIFGREEDPQYRFVTYLRTMVDGDKALRPTTRHLYERNIRVHIEGTELGATDIRDVTPPMLDAFWAALDIGIGAQRNVQQLLSKAFNRALRKAVIDVNPLRRSDVKRVATGRTVEVRPFTVPEVEALAANATNTRDRLEILVMAYGGLRAGEVGGLRIEDVVRDGESCQLRLRQQVVRVTGKPAYVSPLKTKAATRTVSIPCSVADELEAFLKDNPPALDGRIFHGPDGAPRAHNDITHGVQTAAKRAGIEGAFSHRLRHTTVSLWIDDGANPKDVQAMVGHSDIRQTLQTYAALFTYGGAKLAESMEARREKYRKS